MPDDAPIEDLGGTVLHALMAELAGFKRQKKALEVAISETERLILQNIETKEEGTVVHVAGDYKLTASFKLNRTLDQKLWSSIQEQIPAHLRPVRVKYEVDTKGIRYIQNNEPDIYKKIVPALTVKPAKPYLKLEDLDDGV